MNKVKLLLLFCKENTIPPKIYKTQGWANKKKQTSPTFVVDQFSSEQAAMKEYNTHLAEYHKAKLKHINQQNTDNPSLQIKSVKHQCQIEEKQKISLQVDERKKRLEQLIKQKPTLEFLFKYFQGSIPSQPIDPKLTYTGYFDGCTKGNPGPSAFGYYLQNQHQKTVFNACNYLSYKTNNQAEFYGLNYLLVDSYINGVKNLHVFGDSQLLIKAMNSVYFIKSNNLTISFQLANFLKQKFKQIKFTHILRSYNVKADKLANLGMKKKPTQQKYEQKNQQKLKNQQKQKNEQTQKNKQQFQDK